jgi:hypothetical protein
MNKIFCLLMLPMLLQAVPVSATTTSVLEYTGTARDINDSNRVLYRESHRLTLQNQRPVSREVEYHDANGRLLATKTNRYGDNAAIPEFTLTDARKEYREQAVFQGDELTLSLTEQGNSSRKTFRELPDDLIIDAGFDDFVRQHWPALINGERVDFHFASAARQDLIRFRLEPQASDNNELVLSMRLSSRLLAWLLDPIELTYDKTSQRLLRYKGLTNIQDDTGTTFKAMIDYQYHDQATPTPQN